MDRHYLSQTAAGQSVESPCRDAGSATAGDICFDGESGTVCLDELSTRTDQIMDADQVDMGFHYTGIISTPTPTATPYVSPTPAAVPALFSSRLLILTSILSLFLWRYSRRSQRFFSFF